MDYTEKIKTWEQLKVGDKDSFTKTMTETDVIIWVGLTADTNPMHIDKEYSKTTRFGDVLVPGVLVLGLISNVVTRLTLGNVAASMEMKFRRPVYIGDTITAQAEIIEKVDSKHMVKLAAVCLNQNGDIIMAGQIMEYILT